MLCELYENNQLKIYFETPIFLLDKTELTHIARLKEKRNLLFTWRTETRVEYLTHSNITLLQQAGAKVIDIGVESASPEILRRMKKTKTVDLYIKQTSNGLIDAYRNGITLKINILFYIGENLSTLRETYLFLAAHSKYISAISAYPMLVYPGMTSFSDTQKELFKYGGGTAIPGAT